MAQRNADDVIAELEAKIAQRGVKMRALEGRIRALEEALQPFAEAWTRRAPRPNANPRAYQRRLERALDPFYSNGDADDRALTGRHLKDAHDLLSTTEATAEWKH